MKPFLLAVAVTAVLTTLCASFSSGNDDASTVSEKRTAPAVTISSSASKDMAAAKQNNHYYWFLASGDVYDGFLTVGDEETRMDNMFGVICDTNQNGGTIVSRGYVLPLVPHLLFPSVIIFSH